MIDSERKKLEEEQGILMEMYADVEVEPEKYKDYQGLLNLLDNRAERNRCVLDGRWTDF